MKPLKPPVAWGRPVEKLDQEPAADAKQSAATIRIRTAFENREDELEVAGLLDAEVVESGHEPGDADGEDLRPKNGEATDRRGKPMKCGEDAEGAREAAGDGSNGGGLGDSEPRPHIEEGGGVAVRAAEVDIFAARIRQHGAELGVGHGAEEREQAADDPSEIHQGGGAGVAHHFAGHKKDAAADDGADDDGRGLAGAENAREIVPEVAG